ncbi:hypothetical protein Slin15195_G084320 [Septoria linicola]|uniref:PKD domain-containing protein n=1 Tax=Septoria linicola TaxID=215465 RepID=A0A9Q9EN42_9PEZI|nr:hypothetical protein Slin15195_G084320 [Septoria linicola]
MRVHIASTALIWALSASAQETAVECITKGQAVIVTADCIDPEYTLPVFTSNTDERHPVPHHKISGYFNSTEIDFSIYLTPKSQWQGRFFQLVYPSQTADAEDHAILFGVDSGGFTVQASGSQGYRADAAVAKLARSIAQDYYNVSSADIYGYIYGGSGGSLHAIGAAENTFGVWNGCVALVQATPMSIPYNWLLRAFGGFVFGSQSANVIDASQPGSTVELDSVLSGLERAVFEEVTALGVPVKGWEDWDAIVGNRTQLFQTIKDITIPMIQGIDPTYADDFWTKDGYAGAEHSALGEMFRAALVEFNSTIETSTAGENGLTTEFTLKHVPNQVKDIVGLGFSVMVNDTSQHFSGHMDAETGTAYILAGAANETLQALVPGARITVDNRWYLAAHTFYRHQVPSNDSGFYAFDYLRNNTDGEPLYPQRSMVIGPVISQIASGGAVHTGNITMKTIVMDNLLDFDAFPWHADWYAKQVARKNKEEDFRLYFSDNADHDMHRLSAPLTRRVVDWTVLYDQHLRDLSAWVEDGISPPAPSNYTVVNGQVQVPCTASERKEVRAGEPVDLHVNVQVPPGVGQIVALEWDAFGKGEYVKKDIEVGVALDVKFSHVYDQPGVYFAGVRAASHRQGDTTTDIALAWNLDRVRVIVT